jgi:heme/copper-type cytochrome/quinol oxidase subunit 4
VTVDQSTACTAAGSFAWVPAAVIVLGVAVIVLAVALIFFLNRKRS